MISNQFKLFLDLISFKMTASEPTEGKDKERTEATPAEEAQQGTVWSSCQAGIFHEYHNPDIYFIPA